MKIRLSAIFFIAVMLFALCSCSGEKAPAECEVHDFYEETIVRNSTCSEEGVAARICKVCGAKETRTIPALSHSYSSWIKVKDATCVSDGTEERTCYNCGNKETRTVKATGNHSYGSWTTTKEAAYGVKGSEQRTCSVCGNKETRDIPALTVKLSSVLSDPFDTLEQLARCTGYNWNYAYSKGNFYVGRNSANGNMLQWGFQNLSDKTIKYITFTVYYYNAVGDLVEDNIRGKTSGTFRITGPIKPKENVIFRDILMYSSTCVQFYITDVKIEYMDGTIVSGKYNKATKSFHVM